MKVSKLKQIIKEELKSIIQEKQDFENKMLMLHGMAIVKVL